VSVQILQEFYVNAVRKPSGLSHDDAPAMIEEIAGSRQVVLKRKGGFRTRSGRSAKPSPSIVTFVKGELPVRILAAPPTSHLQTGSFSNEGTKRQVIKALARTNQEPGP
jgi:hypothetical protein